VRVDDHCNSTVRLFNLIVHLADLGSCKVLRIKVEVLVIPSYIVFLGPLYVHPKYVDREIVTCEILIPLHDYVCTYRSPLAKVESKHV